MQYMMMLVRSDQEWEGLSAEQQDMPGIGRWWAELVQQGVLRDGQQLEPARTATTVRWRTGQPVITDGPYIEAKESIAGYGILDVPDLDAALDIARSWPAPAHAIELRPIVSRA